MREEVVDYEVNVEKEQVTEERVFCDNCGANCTEDHDVIPMDLCPGCQPDDADERQSPWTFERYQEAYQEIGEEDSALEGESTGFVLTIMGLFWPLFAVACFFDAIDGDDGARLFMMGYLGFLLWMFGMALVAVLGAKFGVW